MFNPRENKRVTEINSQISKLESEKQNIINFRGPYEQFHLNRIEDILFRGTVKTQRTLDTSDKLLFENTEEKLYLLISSLFEMGIIEDFDTEQKIQKNIRSFFKSE